MKELKVAIVGCGAIGLTHGRAWRKVAGAVISHVVDRDAGRVMAAAAELGAEPQADIAALPPEVQVASIATDPASHGPLVRALLERGMAVFCEKPLAMSEPEARALVALARQTGRVLSVGFKMRYEPIFLKARELAGEVGPLVQIATTKMQPYQPREVGEWRPQVGAMNELSVHDFDLVSFITGLEPCRVQAAQLSTRLGWPSEDGFSALVEYEGGVQGLLSGCYTLESQGDWPGKDFSLTLTGERGILRVLRGDRLILASEGYRVWEAEPVGDCFQRELQDFAEALREGHEPPIPPEAGWRSTALIAAIRESGQQQRPVDLLPLDLRS